MAHSLFYILFFFSGAAALGYEIIWTRMLSVGLGHEIVSVLAVVSAYFSGLALGAWILDRPVSQSASPGRWFAFLEIVTGAWALVLIFVMPETNRLVSELIGVTPSPLRHWSISFLYPFILLFPATAAMGGTLPAMDRLVAQYRNNHFTVGGLYSVNTFGAVAGTLMVTFFLLPVLGIRIATVCTALLNFSSAVGLLLLTTRHIDSMCSTSQRPETQGSIARKYMVLFLTGWAGIGFEIVTVRVFSQIFENTVFSFAAMLVVFLLGTALGAGIYQRFQRTAHFDNALAFMLLATALSCLMAICFLPLASKIHGILASLMGKGYVNAIASELLLSALYLFLPTVFMGGTFSHLAQSLKNENGGVGRALCINTIGGAFAPLVFGVMLLPVLGIKFTLFLIPAIYLLCLPWQPRRIAVPGGALLTAIVTLFVYTDGYRFVTLQEGEQLSYHKEGVMASVSVLKDTKDHYHLKVNNHYQMGGTNSVFSDRRQGYLPLLLHSDPEQVLYLGVGSGTTFATAAAFPNLHATGVELIPEVTETISLFEKSTGKIAKNDNLKIITADARRYVTATDRQFDIIIADLFHPARDGAGALYTVEHFSAIRQRLREGGLFCQWLPLYQMDLKTFKVITQTFLQVFPESQAWLAHYSIDQPIVGLIGANEPLRFPERWYRKRLVSQAARRHMAGFGYDSIYSLLGTFMADKITLRHIAQDSPINSDWHPIVLFMAPEFVYTQPQPAHLRLLALLDAFSMPDPESILAEVITEEDYMARSRITNYWQARDSFLKLGMHTDRTNDVRQLYETTSAQLLKVVRQSIDFSAAYYPLISIAYELYPYDRDASRQLLQQLERANPMRREAGALRRKLFAVNSTTKH